MPYKSEYTNLKLPAEHDKRRKLTEEQKDEIRLLNGKVSQRECAKLYNVSRSTIRWIWMPEKHERNLLMREFRGGSMIYYDREDQVKASQKTRQKRQELYVRGELIK
jgi:IS30 family transposase